MTSPGPSPPRSKKESSAASSFATAGSIVGDLDTGSSHPDHDDDDLEVDRATRRELKAEAKAAARAQRAEAKAAARREKDELAAAAKAEREEAQAAEQAARAEANESARVAEQEAQDDTETDDRGPATSLLHRLRKGSAETDTSTSAAAFSATPIADALSAEFPPPDQGERPLSDLADRDRDDDEETSGSSSRAARRAKAAEAKEASRRSRDEAKAAKAAAKSASLAALAATKAEGVTARTDESTEHSDESTEHSDESTEHSDESTEQPDESTPDAPSEAEAASPAPSRIEQQLAEAKQRVEAQSRQDEAEAKSRAIEEAARRDRAEAEAKSREAKEEARRERDEAKAEAKAAKATARRERDEAKAEAKAGKATARRGRDDISPARAKTTAKADAKPAEDDIVEAPREPKVSLAQRLRQSSGVDDADPDAPAGKGRNALAVLAVVLGTLGFICSVVLAIGAFLVALSPHADSAVFHKVSSVCDALVGPLRDVFSFSGVNGDSKDALVAWGLGALGYLIVGLFAQTFLRSHSERQSS